MILKKIHVILLQSASMCLAIIGPTTQKPTLVSSCCMFQRWAKNNTSTVEIFVLGNIWPMSASQQ